MKQFLIAIALLFSITRSFGQGDQTIIMAPINSVATEKVILHLPTGYSTSTANYPLMVFLHGTGEGGTNPASIYGSSSAGGPAYYIAQGKFPSSFINPADGKSYSYIVASPQSTNGWSTTPSQLDTIITFLRKTYRVDAARIYLTGLSAGGEGVLEYVTKLTSAGAAVVQNNKIAAFFPMSAVMNGSLMNAYAKTIIADSVHVWGFGSLLPAPGDVHGINTINLLWTVNSLRKGWADTTTYYGGHCCWGQFYDPNWRSKGKSIYEYALQYTSGPVIAPPANKIPVANAGPDQIITLPANSAVMNSAASIDSDGTIVNYGWSLLSGPNTPNWDGTTLTNLVAGIYTMRLQVTDNQGATATDTMTITVLPAPKTAVFTISLADGKKFTLYSDGSYSLQ